MAIIVGDIHGDVEKVRGFLGYKPDDMHVAIGDYLDSFHEPPSLQLEALHLLLDSKAILLWGNHDLHYLMKPLFRFPGFNPDIAEHFTELLENNINRFFPAYVADGWLCTHAGVNKMLAKGMSVQELEHLFCEEWKIYLQSRDKGYRFKSIFTFDYMSEGTLVPDSIKQIFGHDSFSEARYVKPNCVSIGCTDTGTIWIFDTGTGEIKNIGV